MNNKVLIRLSVPEIDEYYDLFIPINVRIGTVIKLLNKAIIEMTGGVFETNVHRRLFNAHNSEVYDFNLLVRQTDIRNGSSVIFM